MVTKHNTRLHTRRSNPTLSWFPTRRVGRPPKYIVAAEPLAGRDATPEAPPLVQPEVSGRIVRWPTPQPDFAVSMITPGVDAVEVVGGGPRIALVVDGGVTMSVSSRTLETPRGSVVWVPAGDGPLFVEGTGRTFVATVGR